MHTRVLEHEFFNYIFFLQKAWSLCLYVFFLLRRCLDHNDKTNNSGSDTTGLFRAESTFFDNCLRIIWPWLVLFFCKSCLLHNISRQILCFSAFVGHALLCWSVKDSRHIKRLVNVVIHPGSNKSFWPLDKQHIGPMQMTYFNNNLNANM